jgi:hypothetical protein
MAPVNGCQEISPGECEISICLGEIFVGKEKEIEITTLRRKSNTGNGNFK